MASDVTTLTSAPIHHAMPMPAAPTLTAVSHAPVTPDSPVTDQAVPTLTSVPIHHAMPTPPAPITPVVSHVPVTLVTLAMDHHVPMLTSAQMALTTAQTMPRAQTTMAVSHAHAMPDTLVMVSHARMMTSVLAHHVPMVPSVPTLQVVSHAPVVRITSAMATTIARPICVPLTTHAMPMLIAPIWTSAHASLVSAVTDSPVPIMTNVLLAITTAMPMPHAPITTVDSHAPVTPVSMAMETAVPM